MCFTVFLKHVYSFVIFQITLLCYAKSLQSCPTLCDPIDGSPPGSPIPGILQARALEWVAISFSNAWKWKVKVKSFSRVWLLATPWTAAYQAPPSMSKSTGVGCQITLLRYNWYKMCCIYLNHTVWYILTYVCTHKTITIQIVNVFVISRSFLCLYCLPLTPPNPVSVCSAFCHYKLVFIF